MIFPQNFKAVARLQAELHLLKVKKLDACITQSQSHLQKAEIS